MYSPSWQNNSETWSPNTAYVQHLACDGYQHTPWVPHYWDANMVHQQYLPYDDMGRFNNNSSYLNNDVFSCYKDYSP